MVRRAVTTCLALLTAACAGDAVAPATPDRAGSATVEIVVAPDTVSAGSPIPFSVRNYGARQYLWNPCDRRLERRSVAGWVAVDEGERICPAYALVLDGGGHAASTTDLAPSTLPGAYRLEYFFCPGGTRCVDREIQVSNTFQVIPSLRRGGP